MLCIRATNGALLCADPKEFKELVSEVEKMKPEEVSPKGWEEMGQRGVYLAFLVKSSVFWAFKQRYRWN